MTKRSSAKLKFDANGMNKFRGVVRQALAETGKDVKADMIAAQVLPYKEGNLQQSLTVSTDNLKNFEVSLVTKVPYDEYLYYHPEYNFSKEVNKNAKARWFDDWIIGGKKNADVVDAFANNLKKRLG